MCEELTVSQILSGCNKRLTCFSNLTFKMSRGANKATNNEVNELKERMLLLEAKVKALEEKNGEFE